MGKGRKRKVCWRDYFEDFKDYEPVLKSIDAHCKKMKVPGEDPGHIAAMAIERVFCSPGATTKIDKGHLVRCIKLAANNLARTTANNAKRTSINRKELTTSATRNGEASVLDELVMEELYEKIRDYFSWNPFTRKEWEETLRRRRRTCSSFTKKQKSFAIRETVRMRIYMGLTFAEVAGQLVIAVSTSHKFFQLGLDELRIQLTK
jgi:hypothetical protein